MPPSRPPTPRETFACAPATTRGRGVLLGAHASLGVLAYANGKAVVVRSALDPRANPRVYYGHQYDATVARVSPCGRWVASGDAAGHVRVWALPTLVAANDDQDDHRHDETFALKAEHRPLSGAVDDLAWSEDGQRIVACGDGRGGVFARVFMWDSGNQLGDASGPTKRVLSCAFRPSRPFRVVTASEDFGVAHFKGPPFKFDKTPHRHQNYVNCVRYNADGSLFATVGSDGVGVICEGTEGAPAARIPGKAKAPPRWMKKKPGAGLPGDDEEEGHVGTVYACAWAPPGAEGGARNVLVTVGADKTVRVWRVPEDLRVDAANDDAAPPRAVADLPACASVRATTFGDSVGDMCVGCAFVDATRVAVLTLDGAIRIERVDDVMTVADDSEGRDASTTSSASRGGREGEGETTSVLLSRGHPKPVVAMAGAGLGAVHAASLAGDAATCGGRSVVCRWSESRDPRNGASVALPESAGAVRAMAVARRTGRVFAVGVDDSLRWYDDDAHPAADGPKGETAAADDTASSALPRFDPGAFVALGAQPNDVDCSADGAVAAVACADGSVRVATFGAPGGGVAVAAPRLEGDEGDEEKRRNVSTVPCTAVGVCEDGCAIVVGREDGTVVVLERAMMVSSETTAGGDKSSCASWAPRDFVAGPPTSFARRHRGAVTAIACHPRVPDIVVTCDSNREVVVWDARTGAVVMDKMVFHKARVAAAAWSPDGNALATGSLDGSAIVWAVDVAAEAGKNVAATAHAKLERAHPGGVTALAWRDRETLATGGFDACVRTWRVVA